MSSHRAFKSTKTYRPRPEQPEMPAPAPVNAVPALRTDGRESILPTIPISLLFALFLFEAHIQGGWRHLLIPYICVLLLCFFPMPQSYAYESPFVVAATRLLFLPIRDGLKPLERAHGGVSFFPIRDGFIADLTIERLGDPDFAPETSVLKDVTARLYTAHHAPVLVPVQARCASTNPQDARCPFVENIMGFTSQPYIHDVSVLVLHRGADGRSALSRFWVYYKRHRRLPKNWRLGLKGDIVIMRVAAKCHSSVVNLRGSDVKLADFVIAKLAGKVRDFQETRKAVRPECFIMPNMKKVRERRT
ncbi:hypothetical protein FB451DRAFT_1190537 [Mycena latifolia]|nr:hypothetical protein FB451DRAFT_1190537 [Mycena latifolia]